MKLLVKKPDFKIGSGGINVIEKKVIGGIEQSFLIQGEDPANPVLLFLHGGPSMPLPGISSRGRDYTIVTNVKKLVKHYTVVFWDQRGTGKSFHDNIPAGEMAISQFVDDTLELTDCLREKFRQQKIYLFAHSWGTLIGLQAVSQKPDLYYAYYGLSQIVSWTENDKLGYKWAVAEAEKRNNQKALQDLAAVGEPPYTESLEQWAVLRKWQQRFGTLIYTDQEIKHPGYAKIASDFIFSQDYSLADIYNTFFKGFKLIYTPDFVREVATIDFAQTIPAVKLPVTFIHGSKDVHVHGSLLEEYYNKLHAEKGKRLIWMEKSGHAFHPDDTREIERILIENQH